VLSPITGFPATYYESDDGELPTDAGGISDPKAFKKAPAKAKGRKLQGKVSGKTIAKRRKPSSKKKRKN
jgi:hypothetical protein